VVGYRITAPGQSITYQLSESRVGQLRLLETDNVWAALVQPGQQAGDPLRDRVHVPRRDPHGPKGSEMLSPREPQAGSRLPPALPMGGLYESDSTESSRLVSRSMAHKELLEVRSPRWPRSDRGHARTPDLDLDRNAHRQPGTLIRVCVAPAGNQIGESV